MDENSYDIFFVSIEKEAKVFEISTRLRQHLRKENTDAGGTYFNWNCAQIFYFPNRSIERYLFFLNLEGKTKGFTIYRLRTRDK